LKIQEAGGGTPAAQQQIESAVTRFERVHKFDPENAHVAYCLALGYFNLNNIERALGFLRTAVRCSPTVPSYQQAVAVLETLLARQKSTVQAVPEAKKTPMPASLPKTGQKTILVIEDSQTSRKVISMILTREGYHVCRGFYRGRRHHAGRESAPSLILLDIMLPDMTGFDVLPRLKDMPRLKEVPVIMLTGKTGSTDRVLGIRAGSSEYLTKPFNPQKLIGIIKKYL
jgi:CheY-like chemotaxis protein